MYLRELILLMPRVVSSCEDSIDAIFGRLHLQT